MSPGYSEKINVAYKANIIIFDLNTKEGPPFLFMRSTIDKWKSEGRNYANNVFIK